MNCDSWIVKTSIVKEVTKVGKTMLILHRYKSLANQYNNDIQDHEELSIELVVQWQKTCDLRSIGQLLPHLLSKKKKK